MSGDFFWWSPLVGRRGGGATGIYWVEGPGMLSNILRCTEIALPPPLTKNYPNPTANGAKVGKLCSVCQVLMSSAAGNEGESIIPSVSL